VVSNFHANDLFFEKQTDYINSRRKELQVPYLFVYGGVNRKGNYQASKCLVPE
jgi:hypothetical protein